MITLQNIFDAAWQAFIVEGRKPGVDPDSHFCRYLTKDGRKCAVGLVLPEGHEAQTYGDIFPYMVNRWPELFDPSVFEWGIDALADFQTDLHDTLCDTYTGQWRHNVDLKQEYRHIAVTFGLTVPGE